MHRVRPAALPIELSAWAHRSFYGGYDELVDHASPDGLPPITAPAFQLVSDLAPPHTDERTESSHAMEPAARTV